MSSIKLDLREFKHHSSTDKSTTLQHRDGHTITLSHKNLSPMNQEQLQALAKGGDVEPKGVAHPTTEDGTSHQGGAVRRGDMASAKKQAKETIKESKSMPSGKLQGLAHGGRASNYNDANDTTKPSQQGIRVRQGRPEDAKETAERRASKERMVKPKLQGLAEGGDVENPDMHMCSGASCTHSSHSVKMMADGGDTSNDYKGHDAAGDVPETIQAPMDQMAPSTPMPGVGAPLDSAPAQGMMAGVVPQLADPAQAAPAGEAPPMPGVGAGMDNPPQAPAAMDPDSPAAKSSGAAPMQSGSESLDTGAKPDMPQQTPAEAFQAAKDATHQDLLKENQAWAQDLANQHITPKTYQSMYESKGTLGKIGMLFGMMVSGAGAGLSHQPNALLEMMNKEIDRDLDAQSKSKANAQNFLRLNQQQQMQNANIAQLKKEGKLTDAQAKNMLVEANTRAWAQSRMQMNTAALHDLVLKTNNIPEGTPARQKADNTLAMMGPMVAGQNFNIGDQAAIASSVANMGGSNSGDEQKFQQGNQALRMSGNDKLANVNEARHIPGVEGKASRDISEGQQQELQAQKVLDDKAADVLSFIKEHKGTWNPKRKEEAAQKVEEMKNFYNKSIEGGALTAGRLKWYDEQFSRNPTSIVSDLLGSTARLEEVKKSNMDRRDSALKNLGFPMQKPSGQSAGGSNDLAPGESYMKAATPTASPQVGEGEKLMYTPAGKPVVINKATGKPVRWGK